ncbi:MAG TPA: glycosyltransferase family 2 protein [Dehalococcoidia bacterium]|nr:glycosyltransferase family 2 protein [Dehalococcoidia bacterium]
MSIVLLLPLLLIEAWQALYSTYLAVLAAASFFYRRRSVTTIGRRRRFAVLVPAHNEEALLGRLLTSLDDLDYPKTLYEVYVVADNCTDATAAIARGAGVNVFERSDDAARGKGQALRWLMQCVPLNEYDGVLVVDADSVVSANALEAAEEALFGGHELAQLYDSVLNRDESPATALRALSFDLHNRVRTMGQEVLGASVGLMGNGMVISTRLLREGLWDSFGLAEDLEAHARLVSQGHRVHYIDHASALAEMPATLADSAGQNGRWEAGRLEVARRHAPGLIAAGLRRASWTRLSAGIDLLVPPQSVQTLLAAGSLGGALVLGARVATTLALWVVGAQLFYLVAGIARLGRGGVSLSCLLHAPRYVIWKTLLYARVLCGRGGRSWTRGHRGEAQTERKLEAATPRR